MTRLDIVEHGRRRRRRPGVTMALGLLAVLLIVLPIVLLNGRDTPPAPPPTQARAATSPTPTPVVNAVIPKERGKGGTRTITVTFPHGETAEVRYPAAMRLAELGVRPYLGATLETPGKMAEFRLLTAPYQGEAEIAANGPMIRHLTDDVTLWPGPPGVPSVGEVLLFRFGEWRLALSDEPEGLTFEQRKTWAKALRGRVDRNGFLVLSARPPLRPARPGEIRSGVTAGPQLWIGGGAGPLIVLTPTPECERKAITPRAVRQRPDASGGTCHGDIHLAVSGDRGFVQRVLREVRITAG